MANRLVTQVMSDVSDLACVLANMSLNKLTRTIEYKDADEVTIKGSNNIGFELNGKWWVLDTDVDLATGSDMDTGAISNGKDYCVYACDNSGTLEFLISLASTYPAGYAVATSRKLGGFHTLCVDVGTIAGHPSAYATANSILPQSVWDLKHRALNKNMSNAGLVYNDSNPGWEFIYLGSDDGASGVQSVYGATILDTIDWMDYTDRLAKVGMIMEDDGEFQSLAAGSNAETNITGSADPVTTGGHVDTASRRMISNIGCEDCCGALRQWLKDQSMFFDDAVVAGWYDLPGSKGSLYRRVDSNDVKLLAGGDWTNAARCGSRCRSATDYRWDTHTDVGGRGRSCGL